MDIELSCLALGEDGNQIGAHSALERASFLAFILGWMVGAIPLAKSQFSRIIKP
jgi:hypothetical protein